MHYIIQQSGRKCFRLLARILSIFDKKYRILRCRDKRESYLIVLQQNNVEVCYGSLPVSLWLSMTLCDSHSGSLWLYLAVSDFHWLSLALTGYLPVSLWLSLALCDSHSGPLWLTIAL